MRSERHSAGIKPAFAWLLAITFVFAQCLLHVHEIDLDKHSSGSVCKVCVQASSLNSGHVASLSPLPPILAVTSAPTIPALVAVLTAAYFSTQARAPPFNL